MNEADAVRVRYARRQGDESRYSLLSPAVLLAVQERQRAIADVIAAVGFSNVSTVRLLEVGCGTGRNLLEFLRFGFAPEHLSGIELLPESAEEARRVLPSGVAILTADATEPSLISPASQDIVYQATVFSSLLDNAFQQRLADRMWEWVRPGGGVLWYDFTVNNPQNPDVRGVRLRRVRELFPDGIVRARRITVAPPLARIVTRVHPSLYTLLNSCSALRTHILAWVAKRQNGSPSLGDGA